MTLDDVIRNLRSYWRDADAEVVRRAYEFADRAHEGQMRLTGEPYIQHPLNVAGILADIEGDPPSVVSGLLHDVVEENEDISVADVEAEFGRTVAQLVDGVTKLTRIDFRSRREQQAENLRKVFMAMAKDIRVIVIKLADRLHNMRTLRGFDGDPEKQKAIAMETLQIFAPLSHRLGMWKIKWELEDRAFRYVEPEAYADIVRKVNKTREEREGEIQEAIRAIRERLSAAGIDAEVTGRPKHLYSIYQKMAREGVNFDQIHDLTAIRIVVNTIAECYAALGLVHDLWMPIPDMFTDYIAKPKANKYQSLHTKVMGLRNQRMEVQIRTWDMHRQSEYGVAAHWRYKEGGQPDAELDERLSWMRQLIELETEVKESDAFLSSLKVELFRDEVFVFTPKHDVIDLPAGATPIDFAYRIHTEVGRHCVGAKVNGRMVPLDYTFANGDICQVVTSAAARPSPDWLRIAKTSGAKSKIRRFLRQQHRQANVEHGREMLERELGRLQQQDRDALDVEAGLAALVKQFNFREVDDIYAALGYGDFDPENLVNRLRAKPAKPKTLEGEAELLLPLDVEMARSARASVSAGGVAGFHTRLSKCCSPLPGDEIVGYVTRGRGLAIHRADCKNIAYHARREPTRLVRLDWTDDGEATYQADLQLDAIDRVGLLADISALVGATEINIASAHVRTDTAHHAARIHLTLDIRRRDELNALIRRLDSLPDIMRVRIAPHEES